jgi:hypothetical protein
VFVIDSAPQRGSRGLKYSLPLHGAPGLRGLHPQYILGALLFLVNCPRWRSAPIDTLTELRQLAEDLTALGDYATAALVRQAIDRFAAWKFDVGEMRLERALEKRCGQEVPEPPRSPYFNTCVLAIS